MFPCSSTTSDYQLSFPFTNINDDENPNSISHDHRLLHHYPPYSHSDVLEHDGLLLSYLLSQQQLLVGNCSANATNSGHIQAHESAEISFVGSNSNKEMDQLDKFDPPEDEHEVTIVPEAAASKGSSSKINKKSTSMKMNGGGGEKKAKAARKRSSGKKDRHSKIYTAQGPRDRRMRLSLQIARKFFDLQDMLGFDKASKTIDWLFTKSKTAIKELKQHFLISPNTVPAYSSTNATTTNSESATSEVASKIMETSSIGANGDVSTGIANKEKKNRKLCVVAKESRVEARARARERTREKLMRTRSAGFDDHDGHHQNLTKQIPEQVLPNPINDDDLGGGGGGYFWSSLNLDCSSGRLVSSVQGSGANSEDCEFPRLIHGNWNQLRVGKPRGIMPSTPPTSYSQEQKPSSIFVTSTRDQNPNSIFMVTSGTLVAQHQNPTSSANFASNSNICLHSQFLGK